MYDVIDDLVTRFAAAVGVLDSSSFSGDDAVRLVAVFSRLERLAAAGRALTTKRVLETRAWQGRGFRNPAQWIAANTGSSVAAAVGAVATARALDALPATRSALVDGRVSQAQAAEIVVAAAADPASEAGLLAAVDRGDTYKQLRDRCASVVVSAAGDEDAHERARRGRYFKHRFDGTFVLIDARLAPADAAPMIAYADKRGMQLWEQARRSKRPESRGACMADAITAAFAGGGAGGGGVATSKIVVNVHCDEAAFDRGHTLAGERCEIDGIGPVSVSTARAMAAKGYVKKLGRNDYDITRVKHNRKDIPDKLRSAIEARDQQCVVPGCDVRIGLEIDHVTPRADGGATCYDNLARLCGYDHYLKTHHGWTLSGKPGAWEWKPPPPGWKPKRPYNRNPNRRR